MNIFLNKFVFVGTFLILLLSFVPVSDFENDAVTLIWAVVIGILVISLTRYHMKYADPQKRALEMKYTNANDPRVLIVLLLIFATFGLMLYFGKFEWINEIMKFPPRT